MSDVSLVEFAALALWIAFIGLAALGLLRVIDLVGFYLGALIFWWDRRADRAIAKHLDAALPGGPDWIEGEHEAEILDRLEAELDHRAIRKIDDEYGHRRWAR